MTQAQDRAPVVAIVQARMGSARLPGKSMADVAGKPILRHVLERLCCAQTLDRVVVATTTQPRDDVITQLASQMDIGAFRGSEEDVLERYYLAAQWCGAGTIVRVCGEDLFLDPPIVDRLVTVHLAQQADYTTNTIGRTFPEGLYVEVLSREALQLIQREAVLPHHREHVTSYVLDHPTRFRIERIEATGAVRRPEITLAVDTEEDLAFVRAVHAELGRNDGFIAAETVLDRLDREQAIERARNTSDRGDVNP